MKQTTVNWIKLGIAVLEVVTPLIKQHYRNKNKTQKNKLPQNPQKSSGE
jgi:short-subunit dehydrogenase involved in D-alanine esterification of teichoic acids